MPTALKVGQMRGYFRPREELNIETTPICGTLLNFTTSASNASNYKASDSLGDLSQPSNES